MKRLLLIISVFYSSIIFSQGNDKGLLTGNIIDANNKALIGATVTMVPLADSSSKKMTATDKDGDFSFQQIAYGYYQLRISFTGLQSLTIDSIWFRSDRSDFNLSDLTLKPKQGDDLQEVIVYAEKPLIQSKDGNITFNAAESPLSAGSNVSDLLQNIPLVSKDADGKVTVRGKEPKILIDDKPVQLNQQQLQDLLESLPGSSIEKIEIMTNPPPQYANEQGGVINIITKKGKVGKSGRIAVSAGTRGESSLNGSFNYRKKGFALTATAGAGYSRFKGNGYSIRNNIYADSSNFFNTSNNNFNKNMRPNIRVNMDYDINKAQSLNMVLQYNQNDPKNQSITEYKNINRFGDLYRLSDRTIISEGDVFNTNLSLAYRLLGKLPGETFRVVASANLSGNDNDRDFYQQFFNPDHTPNGTDSTQQQLTTDKGNGYNITVSYDRPFKGNKTFLSTGAYYLRDNSNITVDASYLKKPDNSWLPSPLLSNDFKFHQTVINGRLALRRTIVPQFNITAGLAAENTNIWFELFKENRDAKNSYITFLPFANLSKTWQEKYNLSFAYRRSIRRPNINEMNPTIDFSDPYTIRFGNEKLEASTADNFDLVFGSNRRLYFMNIGVGYNIVSNIFSRVRTLLPDSKTQLTWENISGRKEYEISAWGGLTIVKQLKANASASYTYNQYSAFDKAVNRYRNGSSFTSTISSTYIPKDVWNVTGSFTFNRFANPQGYAKWNSSMNIGLQRKLLSKRLVFTFNAIDPFMNQQRRVFTYGPNFNLESFSLTHTRNFRLSVAYNFIKPVKKIGKKL
ncbi:MAG: outer membrane beta-barrel protein [Chitinophagaceae bacterium]